MSDFDLDAAVAAARVRAAEATTDGTATRLRIRETLARRPTSRARRTAIVTGLLATIFGSTAFAYYAGWRPPWVARTASLSPAPVVSTTEPRVPVTKPNRPRSEPARVEALPAPAAEPAPIVEPAKAVEIPQPVAAPAPSHSPKRMPPRTEPVAIEAGSLPAEARVEALIAPPTVTPDPELAAYRVAHEAHFRGGDPTAALRAWDAYLAAYPSGKLAVDARYSRALILIKLERWSDAATALRPFAEAPTGSYRQADAARLLAALPRAPR